ncbi:TonB-dependent receptor domain-containing protein [Chitinophaga sp. 30R24]|uniref:TonB-dependent receptor n=1 Tax=Chitinophaga sp. 30R24 TaxID=3248838 RepID=UPI003B907D5C
MKGAQFTGTVKDAGTMEPVIGALIAVHGEGELKGRIYRTTTDFNGSFVVDKLHPGRYTAKVQYMGYQVSETTFAINGQGENVNQAFLLKTSHQRLNEVVVNAKQDGGSAHVARKIEKNADQIMNVVSAKAIEVSPDITVANVIQRVSGVSLERSNNGDGRFAIIRGMDKRYTYTLINGIKVPSPDNKNRYVPLDIFPAELMERIEVNKTLTPNMEADAIGGSINLVMKNAPDRFLISANAGSGYSQYFFDHSFMKFDKGAINDKSPLDLNGPGYNATSNDFSRGNLDFKKSTAAPYGIFGLTLGDRFLHHKLGVLVGGSYQHTSRGSENTFFKTMTSIKNTPLLQDIIARNLSSNLTRSAVHTKIDYQLNSKNEISLYGLYTNLQNVESRISSDTSLTSTRTGPGTGKVTTLSRSRYQTQYIANVSLQGKHNLLPALSIDWTGSYAKAGSKLPDWVELNTFSAASIENGAPYVSPATLQPFNRIWQHNTDKDLSGYLNVHYKPMVMGKRADFSVGGLYRHKTRENYFNTYTLEPVKTGNPATFPVFENIYHAQYKVANPNGNIDNALNYNSSEDILAYYAQLKFDIDRLQVIGGARVEETKQAFDTRQSDLFQGKTGKLTYTDLLPSIHLKYQLQADQQLRLSVYTAIARPNYFDLIPYVVTATDNFDEAGNPNLKHTTSTNFDLRYEWFPKVIDQFVAGVFYKDIHRPIEFMVNDKGQIQPMNLGNATNKGLELVGVKYFRQFGVSANYTFTLSSIKATGVKNNYNPITNTLNTPNQLIVPVERPLQGQSKHIANLTVFYKQPKAGLDLQLASVYTGSRIVQVSQFADLDYWQRGNVQLDFSAEKKLSEKFGVYIKLQNLLNNPSIVEIRSPYTTPVNGSVPLQKENHNLIVQKDIYGQSFLFGLRYRP